ERGYEVDECLHCSNFTEEASGLLAQTALQLLDELWGEYMQRRERACPRPLGREKAGWKLHEAPFGRDVAQPPGNSSEVMSMEPLGIGIVGAGFIAELHARIYQDLQGFGANVIGVAARDPSKTESFAQRYGIERVHVDARRLLEDPAIKIIDICAPNHAHAELAILAAQAGKHIICAKPLTGYFGDPSAADSRVGLSTRSLMLDNALRSADAMIQAARNQRVKLMYAENWVYAPAIQKAKRLIKTSRGTIFELRAEESHHGSHSSYAKHWRYTGG